MKELSQNERILDWLKKNKTINPLEAWLFIGCYRLAARICELRKNYNITTKYIQVKNQFGEYIKVAEYELKEKEK